MRHHFSIEGNGEHDLALVDSFYILIDGQIYNWRERGSDRERGRGRWDREMRKREIEREGEMGQGKER